MSENDQLHYVGICRICGTGPLGLRECGQCGEIVAMCDECDAVWTDSNFDERPILAGETSLPCPFCGASLFDEPARWASRSAIDKLAWLQTALRSGNVEVKQGTALDRRPEEDA
ncbi:MAG: hypothetical protein AAGD11_08720 [Planctomycetota bacterium]